MKNLYLQVFTITLSVLLCTELYAQKTSGQPVRCFTMQRAEKLNQINLLTRNGNRQKENPNPSAPVLSTYRLTATVMVPVVVHIVLPNPFMVTDADVQAQIDRLNLDFSGLNPDSTNAPSQFLAVRGHSQIQFCLAKRTPGGQITSGIERRISSVGSIASDSEKDPIKYASTGGLDQWDPNAYLNLWVGNDDSGGDILGYAQFPGSPSPDEDGVFISYQSWATNDCYTLTDYNKGRTATHEIGHYFGLLHIWGDDDGCTGDDFRGLTGLSTSCSIPAGLYNPDGKGNTAEDIGDTPNQAGQTTNCPSGVKTDACTTTAPGIMYQNFMDYSLDACLTMFTKKQVERMEWVLDNCRASLKTSLGCTPPVTAIVHDAAPLQSVNPGGFELSGCNTRTYSSSIFCAGSFTPKIRIVNNSTTTLTSVTVGYIIDNGTPVTQTVNVNLGLGASTVINFPAVAVAAGDHQIKFFTSNPNGSSDQVSGNDTLTTSFKVNGTASVPFIEDFTSTTFPPPKWSIINPDGDTTWQRYEIGNGNPGSAYVNTFDYTSNGETDDLVTPLINYNNTGIDSIKLSFDVASATYTDIDDPFNAGTPLDTLSVLVTADCGNTFTTVYKKWGKDLRTVTTPLSDPFFPSSSDEWRRDTVDLTAFADQSPIQLLFRVTNNYENNVFVDNVNVFTTAVPKLLKEQGYLILPNPFRQSFAVWHYKPPTTLRSLKVYNSVGQLVWRKDYNGNASNYIRVDLFNKAAGVYVVRLEYQDASKNVSGKVVKY